jgi:four helix bundle protein
MTAHSLQKKYDLEERTLAFARSVRDFSKSIPKEYPNKAYIGQLLRSSSSVGANYLEANGKLGKKDLLMHIRICRKEARESGYWLELIEAPALENTRIQLQDESIQLSKIFGSIITKISS